MHFPVIFFNMRGKQKECHIWARALLILLLLSFCAPFTMFDEASAYLADTESELVHYYLTPLPDNGEACVDIPEIIPPLLESRVSVSPLFQRLLSLSRPFYHPPK